MNVLFLTLLSFESLQERNIYTDLLREFVKNGHHVFAVSPVERRFHEKTNIIEEEHATILRLQIGNTQKTNIVEKGISTVLIEPIFKSAIAKFFANVRFDLVLYSTPPITLVSSIKFVKKRDKAKTYLLLKDIFPQNAVDMGMLSKTGIKGLIYKHFRKKEQELYAVSDYIGCMSQANVDFVIKHNPEVPKEKVEVFPNCIDVQDINLTEREKEETRLKYGLPLNKMIFVYGGNLGKPQDISFIIECLKIEHDNDRVYFLIAGDGTEYNKLEDYYKESNQHNFKLLRRLPANEFDKVLASSDVGLLFLDHRFTIPNFPSRLLSYMQAGLPVLACTDTVTDVGKIIVEGGFGWWCESNSIDAFSKAISQIVVNDQLRNNSKTKLKELFSVSIWYKKVLITCEDKSVH